LQYGPPAPPVVAAATQAATAINQQVEAPAPAAVQASETIKKKAPAPKPTAAAVSAATNIAAKVTPPKPVISVPKSLEEAKVVTVATTKEIVKQVENAPLWLRITGSAVGLVFAVKGVKKLFGIG
jgi:cobalamin biosynthesis Mg chelatase CobN